jgi:RND family efflux transporter MFP subunit
MISQRMFILAGFVGAFALVGCWRRPVEKAADADGSTEALVRVAPIRPMRAPLVRFTEQPGQISPLEETPIFARLSGYVSKVHVDIGDRVTAGAPLVTVDAPELEKELAQKDAAVVQAQSEVKQSAAAVKVARAMHESALAGVTEAEAMVDRADADYAQWESAFSRMTELVSRKAVTDKLAEETRNKFKAAEAAKKEIAAKVQSAAALARQAAAQIEKAQADAEAAGAKLGVAQADQARSAALLAFRDIRAPFDGVVAARHVDTGHLVSPGATAGEPLLVVVRPEVVRISVDVPEVDAVAIEPGAEATIRIPSRSPTAFVGKVTRTTWVLNQATRTLRTEIDVDNADRSLRPGMYAYARLKVAERPSALVVPKTALMTTAGETACWRIDSAGTLIRQKVETGLEADGKVEVLAGLDERTDLIGVNPAAFREGQRVQVQQP